MSFLVLLWMVIFGILLLAYLGFPIFSKAGGQHVVTSEEVIEERRRTLFHERESSYAALADLDEDYETGKLSEADYEELREELLQETARVIMQLENESLSDVEAEIERFKEQQRGT
jgi:tyrosyl-tRNA synthetase